MDMLTQRDTPHARGSTLTSPNAPAAQIHPARAGMDPFGESGTTSGVWVPPRADTPRGKRDPVGPGRAAPQARG